MIDLSLILPVHNEEDIIEPVYKTIRSVLDTLRISYEVFLVENGSRDSSLQVCKRLAKTYRNTRVLVAPQGYGSAVIAGLNNAGGKYVSYMPSDGQIDMAVFPRLWNLALSRKWDLVKVRRVSRESTVRSFVSRVFSTSIQLLFDTDPIDINGSPRIFLRREVPTLALSYADSFIDAEFAAKAKLLGWRIKEIPMATLPRVGGASTRSWKTFAEFFKNIARFKTSGELAIWKKKTHQMT